MTSEQTNNERNDDIDKPGVDKDMLSVLLVDRLNVRNGRDQDCRVLSIGLIDMPFCGG